MTLLLFPSRAAARSVVLLQSLVGLSEWLLSVGDVMGVGSGSGARPSRRSGPSGPSPDGTPSHLSALLRDRKTSGEAGCLRRLEYNFEKFVLKGTSCQNLAGCSKHSRCFSVLLGPSPTPPLPCPHLFSLGADGAGQGRGWGAQPQVSLGAKGGFGETTFLLDFCLCHFTGDLFSQPPLTRDYLNS